jgi:diguanylate cyclase (GGDEF)-like protein
MAEVANASPHPQAVAHPAARSEFELVLEQGFSALQFPPALEAQYLQDKSAERLKLIKSGAMLVIWLSNCMLLTDWLMIPDQFYTALQVRLFMFTPVMIVWYCCVQHVSSVMREWVVFTLSLVSACITVYLSLSSTNALGPPYLVCLSLIQLFNGGVVRMRFWMAVGVDGLVLVIYAAAVCALHNPPMVVLTALAIELGAVTVFTLYGSYRLEHEDRSNWLMQQHENLLLEELEKGNQRLDRLSRFDPLTEIANRRHFDEFLEQVWARAQQSGQTVSLLMMDIDHFKSYNDHYGHPAGDACLKDVAEALSAHLRRPGDMVARFGGEEFIAVLTDTSLPMALVAAERVRAGVEALGRPHAASSNLAQVTVSIGVASVQANAPHASPSKLVAAADEALYQAKSGGRNRVVAARQAS